MSIYSQAKRTTNTNSNEPCHTILAALTDRFTLLEAGFSFPTSVVGNHELGYGRPAANGTGAVSGPFAMFAENPGDPAATTTTMLDWTTEPTTPTTFLRKFLFPASTIGVGVMLTFPKGIVVNVNGQFVLQNIAASSVVDSYFVIDE